MRDIVCAPFAGALRELDLSRNKALGLEGARALATWLPRAANLRALVLSECGFGDDVGLVLARAVENGGRDARGGSVGGRGGGAPRAAPTLLRLDLRRNELGDQAAEALLGACEGKGVEGGTRLMLGENERIGTELRGRAEKAEEGILRRMRGAGRRTWREGGWG